MTDYLISNYNAKIEEARRVKDATITEATQRWHCEIDEATDRWRTESTAAAALWQASSAQAEIELTLAMEHRSRLHNKLISGWTPGNQAETEQGRDDRTIQGELAPPEASGDTRLPMRDTMLRRSVPVESEPETALDGRHLTTDE